MTKRKKRKSFSDQLRDIIVNSQLSRYQIAKQSGVDASQIHRFVKKQRFGGLTTETLDRLDTVLKLRVTVEE